MVLAMVVSMLAGLAVAEAPQKVWVDIAWTDPASKEEQYYFGQVDKAALEKLTGDNQGPPFLRVDNVCWFELDEDDRITGIIEYADEKDTGTVLVRTSLISRISLMKKSPRDLVKDTAKEPVGAIRKRPEERTPAPL